MIVLNIKSDGKSKIFVSQVDFESENIVIYSWPTERGEIHKVFLPYVFMTLLDSNVGYAKLELIDKSGIIIIRQV